MGGACGKLMRWTAKYGALMSMGRVFETRLRRRRAKQSGGIDMEVQDSNGCTRFQRRDSPHTGHGMFGVFESIIHHAIYIEDVPRVVRLENEDTNVIFARLSLNIASGYSTNCGLNVDWINSPPIAHYHDTVIFLDPGGLDLRKPRVYK
ncbi:hypothetical protein Tco_0280327 [Tanacetum coccineum]